MNTLSSTFDAARARSDQLYEDLKENPARHRVLTGDRPTGPLHIGHEFGSIQNRVRLQDSGVESFIVIADYQVLTDRRDSTVIPANVRDIVLDYLSLGLDPWGKRTFIFTHSQIPELHQLVLPFALHVTLGELERNPTIKDEIRASRLRTPSAGMLIYPISQAADILFCKPTVVPVGKDQLPHIELMRKIASRFNRRYGCEVFPQANALLSDAPLVLGLDGTQKMSKSRNNAIFLTMTNQEVRESIMGAKTDSHPNVEYDINRRPEVSNLVRIFSLCAGLSIDQVVKSFEGKGFVVFKEALADVVCSHLEPVRKRREQFAKEKGLVSEVLQLGTTEARQRALTTLSEVRSAMNMSLDKIEALQ